MCGALGRACAAAYPVLAPSRREVVVRNLLPALGGDLDAARLAGHALFRHFALKVVDLWRCEAGLPIDEMMGATSGWEHFLEVRERGQGVLFLIPHIGNWELGGPWLARRGVPLHVITLAEPGAKFTAMRQAARARWNIETLVIGEDPFAFVEVIRKLESGAAVALLLDRPLPATAVRVNLFGRPFDASVAAAELARASGCALLPAYVPRRGKAYEAHILPPVRYDRPALRDRRERQRLTQEIVNLFEPVIRQHLDQWYHFVPIWPERNGG
jgi:KDO2-lipid IV(A) lauroyltransferase